MQTNTKYNTRERVFVIHENKIAAATIIRIDLEVVAEVVSMEKNKAGAEKDEGRLAVSCEYTLEIEVDDGVPQARRHNVLEEEMAKSLDDLWEQLKGCAECGERI